MTADELNIIADASKDLFGLLHGPDPARKANLYRRIGLRMTYCLAEKVISEVVTSATRVFAWCPKSRYSHGSRFQEADLLVMTEGAHQPWRDQFSGQRSGHAHNAGVWTLP
ncbi:hypothetical protein AB0M20_31000 [Actinoplanes sp. NPDC051633]|uniref:hypothetical protein n=1 Tax=Actinoplanes sp. NPDC051633 TaxID=3155670 RepID=UPI00343E3B46